MTEITAQSVVVLDGEKAPPPSLPLTLDNETGLEIEVPEEQAEAALETVTDSAVEIASIEAAKEVAIAEIQAETVIAVEEQITERVVGSEGNDEWRMNMEERLRSVTDRLDQFLDSQLTPQPSEPMETISIPQSTLDEISEIKTEVIEQSEQESQAETQAPKRRQRRAI